MDATRPSGLQLMDLIRHHIGEILSKEEGNSTAMYLYRTGAYWTAFEQSAFLLESLCGTVSIIPVKIAGIPLPVVTAGLENAYFPKAVQGLPVLAYSSARAAYRLPDLLDGRAYHLWHMRKAETITSALRNGILRNNG